MGRLATMYQRAPDDSAKHLAGIYTENRDDCLRTLRMLLRELLRMLHRDINLVVFCKVFLNSELNKKIESSKFRDRIFHSIVDIICLCMLLLVSPQVREASISLRVNKDSGTNNAILKKFYNQIELDSVSLIYIVEELMVP
ncbi:hypothetical protein GQX74_004903 [Glossina fuscipes]|nr:hypothetical protein GQX74_004903 [Glossina fuscipes]